MEIAEFLLARIAEDEEAARAATAGPWIFDGQGFTTQSGEPFIRAPYHELDITEEDEAHVVRWRPDRVLAKCAADRRIVLSARQDGDTDMLFDGETEGERDARNRAHALTLAWVIRRLALPYADHDDYNPEWKV